MGIPHRPLRLPNGWSSLRVFLTFLLSKSDCIIIFIHHATWYCTMDILQYIGLHVIHRRYTWQTAKNMHLTIRRKVGGISMEDFGVLWVWEFCGNSHGFFSVGMGWVWELKFNSHGSPGYWGPAGASSSKRPKTHSFQIGSGWMVFLLLLAIMINTSYYYRAGTVWFPFPRYC